MPEHLPTSQPPDAQHIRPRSRFDLTTIMGIPVHEIEVHPDMEAMASAYMSQLKADKTNKASYAELAWAFRRQLQEDVKI